LGNSRIIQTRAGGRELRTMEECTSDFLFGGIISIFAWFFGGLDGFLIVLITLSIIDWLFGTLDKYTHGGLDPKDFWRVLSKKIAEFCFVGIAHVIDKYMLGDTATFRTAVTLFYIVVEGKSIIEHTDALSLPIPQLFKKKFSELEKKLNETEIATRGDSIQRAIDSEVFKESAREDTNTDIEKIYTNIFDE